MIHIPVLQEEVLKYLDPKPNENFIDCTVGGGGHAAAILEKTGLKGELLGIDADEEVIKNLELGKKAILVCDNFVNLKEIVEKENFKSVSGILFDLGMSSWHLEASGRGFSFLRREPLDMRYSVQNPLTAEKILNFWSEPEIEKILKEFGEETFAKTIAGEIIKERRVASIKNTFQLVEIIRKAVPGWYQHRKTHFATKSFQALRIAVNKELDNLEKSLPQALEILKKSGRLVVISFHSLEDRIVKNFFKENCKKGLLQIITKKPVVPTKKEIINNSRSRSAKLRAGIKI